MPVVLFHAGLGFPGGYVGVDIFFVISGYLISLGLFKENEDGNYSLLAFYERRIRRIIPALTIMVLIVYTISYCILLPSELVDLSHSAISSALFYSNVYFWETQNYFGGANISKPLLHTWSLAVEEQFYIFWPIVVWAIYRLGLKGWRFPMILVAVAFSLVATEAFLSYSPKTAFYMFPLRAWELLVGALLAAGVVPRMKSFAWANILSLLALALICWPIFTLSEESRFPGLSAGPAVTGSALLIHIGRSHRSLGTRLLSFRPPVAIGLISYSLYLWHWPILSLYTIAKGVPADPVEGMCLVVLSLIAAWFSWRFVELPFRTSKARRQARAAVPVMAADAPQAAHLTRKRVLWTGAATICGVAALGGVGIAASGFPGRLNPQAREIDAHKRQSVKVSRGCIVMDAIPDNFATKCLGNAGGTPARVAVWGDSFARQYVNVLKDRYRRRGIEPLFLIATGCTPLPSTTAYFGKGRADDRCSQFNDQVLTALLRFPALEQVIIAGRWSNLAGLSLPGERSSPSARYLTDRVRRTESLSNSLQVMDVSLAKTIRDFESRGVQVTLLKEPPRYAKDVLSCAARASWTNENIDANCGTSAAVQRSFHAPVDAVFARLQNRFPDLTVYDPLPFLCLHGTCSGYRSGIVITEDVDHLSQVGSTLALRGFSLPTLGATPSILPGKRAR